MADGISSAEFKLKRAKIALSKDYPFFSDILFFMDIVKDNSIPTMAVDTAGKVYYNEEFVDKMTVSETKGVLCHETVHPAWQHLSRGMNKLNKGVWNLAIDCHANMMVIKQGLKLPKIVACSPNIYNDTVNITLEGWQYEVEHTMDKASEVIYDELMNKMPQKLKDKLVPGWGDIDQHRYIKMSKEELDRIDNEWKQRVTNAAERARQAGKLPAGMDRLLGDILNPEVDWRILLYQFITSGLPSDRTWARRDRRYAAHGLYMPDQKRESVMMSAFIDTSGSIQDAEINKFKSELIGCKRQFDSMALSLGFCDDKVYEPILDLDNVEESDIMSAKPKGNGGTDMRKCVEWLKKNRPDTEVVTILTDGYTPFPQESDVPSSMKILWLICPNGIRQKPDNVPGDFVFMRGD